MDLDVTLLAQLTIFVVVLFGLNLILFKPLLTVLDTRDQKLNGARDEVQNLSRLSAADLEVYQTKIREARDAGQREREAMKNEGRERERKILTDVRTEITHQLNAARERIGGEADQQKRKLAGETEGLAAAMVEKVLGRSVEGRVKS